LDLLFKINLYYLLLIIIYFKFTALKLQAKNVDKFKYLVINSKKLVDVARILWITLIYNK